MEPVSPGSWSLSLEDIQNPAGHRPEKPAIDDPALSRAMEWTTQSSEFPSSLNDSMIP